MKDTQHPVTRQEVLTLLLAREAEQEQAVQEYRRQLLREALIEPASVAAHLHSLEGPTRSLYGYTNAPRHFFCKGAAKW